MAWGEGTLWKAIKSLVKDGFEFEEFSEEDAKKHLRFPELYNHQIQRHGIINGCFNTYMDFNLSGAVANYINQYFDNHLIITDDKLVRKLKERHDELFPLIKNLPSVDDFYKEHPYKELLDKILIDIFDENEYSFYGKKEVNKIDNPSNKARCDKYKSYYNNVIRLNRFLEDELAKLGHPVYTPPNINYNNSTLPLDNLFKKLLDGKYINNMTKIGAFKRVLQGNKKQEKIDWVAKQAKLYFFINCLFENPLFDFEPSQKWKVASESFTHKGVSKTANQFPGFKKECPDEIQDELLSFLPEAK